MPSSRLILCHPLLLLPPIPPSIRVFSNESTLCMRWPKYLSISFSISPSKEHPGLISFRMDWLDLLAVQGTLKSLLQHHSSKASILRLSAFFTVQLSHPYMTTGKTIALTRWTFVGKVMSLLLNMLSAAAAAKSLQSCLTLFDPKDGSPPGSPIPGILQARTLEWVVISFYSNHLLFHPKYELPDSSIIYFPTSPKSPAFSNKTWFTRNFNCEMAREGITRW